MDKKDQNLLWRRNDCSCAEIPSLAQICLIWLVLPISPGILDRCCADSCRSCRSCLVSPYPPDRSQLATRPDTSRRVSSSSRKFCVWRIFCIWRGFRIWLGYRLGSHCASRAYCAEPSMSMDLQAEALRPIISDSVISCPSTAVALVFHAPSHSSTTFRPVVLLRPG